MEALAAEAALSVANASRHLQVLRASGLVERTKKGLHVEYRLADDGVVRFFLSLREPAHTRPEVDLLAREHLRLRGALEPVRMDELLRRARAGEVTLLDVRPAEVTPLATRM